MEDLVPDLPGQVRQRMTELRVTQRDLADAAGVAPGRLSNWLKGRQDIRAATLQRILGALGGELSFAVHEAGKTLPVVAERDKRRSDKIRKLEVKMRELRGDRTPYDSERAEE